MVVYNFKKISVVPGSSELIDICLSRTQRRTPTVVHKGYKISRIRAFYMRKVRFTQSNFDEKLGALLSEFPRVNEIHPFYADLMNVLYDRDHYKLALGQVNAAKGVIGRLGQHYVRLLRYGDSLYRCKQVKVSALGRMATTVKGLSSALKYLEEVRQHLARLPSIDPTTRTVILCGYPNVGKSSLMNVFTRANVDVQPYAFTTRSLFVGHMDYKYFRWQVIDTPGILDHPLEDRNVIEMLSITALAHLRAAIVFLVDVSQTNEHSVEEQVALFDSIRPLFVGKPLVVALTKSDIRSSKDLPEADLKILDTLRSSGVSSGLDMIEISSLKGDGVMEVKAAACERLLADRVETKVARSADSGGWTNIASRLHVAVPKARDSVARPVCIPESVVADRKEKHGGESRVAGLSFEQQHRAVKKKNVDIRAPARLQRDLCEEGGGPGVYNVDLREHWMLARDEWKQDMIPEIMDGKNVADYIDPEILAKVEALEKEEELRLAARAPDDEEPDEEERLDHEIAEEIRRRKKLVVLDHVVNAHKKRIVPRKDSHARSLTDLEQAVTARGGDGASARSRTPARSRKRRRSNSEGVDGFDSDAMEEDARPLKKRLRSKTPGFKTEEDAEQVAKRERTEQRRSKNAREGRAGVADRSVPTRKPKHLYTGHRGLGKTRSR